MANLFQTSPSVWPKHTGGTEPRPVSYAKLFHAAAALVLPPQLLQAVHNKMEEIGAKVEVELGNSNAQRNTERMTDNGL